MSRASVISCKKVFLSKFLQLCQRVIRECFCLKQEDLIMTKVGRSSDRSESIILGCRGILILLVSIWSKRVVLWSVILGLLTSCVQL